MTLYVISTLFVVIIGIGLVLLGGVLAINAEYVKSLLSEAVGSDASASGTSPLLAIITAEPLMISVCGVLVLLFGNLTNFAVYKVALSLLAMSADVKIIRDKVIDD